MVVPVGRPVQLNLVSTDVNHAFWVPDFLSKRDEPGAVALMQRHLQRSRHVWSEGRDEAQA